VNQAELDEMPRIVATPEARLLLTQGDRAFARSGKGLAGPLLQVQRGVEFRVVRSTRPLRDLRSGETLGHEVQSIGRVVMREGEQLSHVVNANGDKEAVISPATFEVISSSEEIRVGDRLLPLRLVDFSQLVPVAPTVPLQGQVMAVYGNGVTFASQNQVVVLNLGKIHGLQQGHLLTVLKDSRQLVDVTDGKSTPMELKGEPSGQLLVYRSFDKVAYALVVQNTDALKVGDRVRAR
jgi:hypothetical protein